MSFRQQNASTNRAKSRGKLKTKNESKKLVGENTDRVGIWVTNRGTKPVTLAFGETAAVFGEGLTLPKESQPIFIVGFLGEIRAIAESEEPELSYQEI